MCLLKSGILTSNILKYSSDHLYASDWTFYLLQTGDNHKDKKWKTLGTKVNLTRLLLFLSSSCLFSRPPTYKEHLFESAPLRWNEDELINFLFYFHVNSSFANVLLCSFIISEIGWKIRLIFLYGREYLSNAKRGCFLRQDQDVCGLLSAHICV